MISLIVNMLNLGDYYGDHELIDIAKGKYKIAEGWSESLELAKRIRKGKK